MRKAKRHTENPNGMGGPCCRKCGLPWPCDAAVLTQELAAIRKRLDRIASVNDFLAARKERESAVLLRDTAEDRERLLAAFDEAYDWCEDWGDKHQHIGCVTARGADAIIAALRGEA